MNTQTCIANICKLLRTLSYYYPYIAYGGNRFGSREHDRYPLLCKHVGIKFNPISDKVDRDLEMLFKLVLATGVYYAV